METAIQYKERQMEILGKAGAGKTKRQRYCRPLKRETHWGWFRHSWEPRDRATVRQNNCRDQRLQRERRDVQRFGNAKRKETKRQRPVKGERDTNEDR
jgi:hypothetical protein